MTIGAAPSSAMRAGLPTSATLAFREELIGAAAGDHVECLARRRRLHSRCGGGPALEVHALIGHGLAVIR
jgi:hypothetical protein